MHIVFRDIGQIKVNHLRQLFNIQTARSNIRGHKNTNLASFKTCQCFGSCALAFIAMNRRGNNALRFQMLGELIGTMFGFGKYQRLRPVTLFNKLGQQRCFLLFINRVNPLLNAGCSLVAWAYRNFDGVAYQPFGQLANVIGERCREQ